MREAIDGHQTAMAAHTRMITFFLIWLTVLNAGLIVGTAAIGLTLWANGVVGAAIVATALPLAWQTANAAGWVSWEVTAIFENVGVVQEGMQSIAVPHTGVDRPDARPLDVAHGEIHFERLTFGYGRKDAPPVVDKLDLAIRPGERVGIVGRSGAGKSTLVNLLLRFHDPGRRPNPDRRPGHRRRDAGDVARRDRHGHAGHVVAAPLDRLEHPLWPAVGYGRAGRGRGAQGAGARVHPGAAGLERSHGLRRARR